MDCDKKLFSLETEQALLGAILVNNEVLDLICTETRHFHEIVHGEIYDEIINQVFDGKVASPVSLKGRFEDSQGLKDVGGVSYLARLAGSAATVINAPTYAEAVKDLSDKRDILETAECIKNSLNADFSIEDIISGVEIDLQAIHNSTIKTHKTFEQMVDGTLDRIEACANGLMFGTMTGLNELDELVGGFKGSELIVVAGRPAMGKTTLACQVAVNIARQGLGAIFFTLEMGHEELLKRFFSECLFKEGGYNLQYNRMSQKLNDEEMEQVCRASYEIKKLPLKIDDTPLLDVMKVKSRSRAYIREFEKKGIKTACIFIDYLQLMTTGSRYSGNRVQEISQLTMQLKLLAKELDLPIVVLSQLSRQVEQREDKRPMLSDLRESGSIEQDADVVMFTYRPEYYLQKSEPKPGTSKYIEWEAEIDATRDAMDIIISKQRNGPTGTARQECHLGSAKIKDFN